FNLKGKDRDVLIFRLLLNQMNDQYNPLEDESMQHIGDVVSGSQRHIDSDIASIIGGQETLQVLDANLSGRLIRVVLPNGYGTKYRPLP
ncbi:MAG: hypothetical protein ABIJ08_07440, partial [Nanoarchaeota archaeon]